MIPAKHNPPRRAAPRLPQATPATPGAGVSPPSYPEALSHMKAHLGRLAVRFRVEVSDIRQTLYLVWYRIAGPDRAWRSPSREAFYKYLYRALENELHDSIGVHPAAPQPGPEGGPPADLADPQDPGPDRHEPGAGEITGMLHGEAEERLSGLRMRGCAEQAFPEAVRNHPLYALPAYRTVLEGVLGQEAPARIAGRLGVTRRRVNAQIEDLHRIFACPDPGQVDRIFRTVPEAHWLPGAPLVHRPIRSLRFRPPQTQSSAGVVPALRRFLRLGAQPAVVHVDQYNRVLSGVDVCLAARILGLTVVATLLQVVRSPSADLDDPEYLAACADSEMARSPASAIPAAHAASTARAPGAGAGPQPALIPALAGLLQEGYLSPLAASLLEPLGAAAQYVVLRELGTALLPLLGVREARSLLQSRQDPAFAQAVRALRERLLQRIPAGAGAAPARSARAGTGAAARPRAAGRSAGLSRGGSDSPG